MWLFLKNIIFTVFVPGIVAVYIPYRIIREQYNPHYIEWGILQIISVVIIFFGAVIYFRCLWDFAVTGRGTPAPIDAPKHLVIKGLYRYVRNPMYIGVLMIILGWAAFFISYATLLYLALVWVVFQCFIMFIEEPVLHRKFGNSYKDYCKQVKRWIPNKGYNEKI